MYDRPSFLWDVRHWMDLVWPCRMNKHMFLDIHRTTNIKTDNVEYIGTDLLHPLRVWPWWCVWAGQGCSCPDSWCILTRRCWGGGLSATGSPAAGLPRHCPGWRWWRLYLHQHPRVSRSYPLRQRSVGSCQGSSWPGGFKSTGGQGRNLRNQ